MGRMLLRMPMACILLASWAAAQPGATTGVRTPKMNRVVRIPVRSLDAETAATEHGGTLTVSAGAADELPEGPDGFEVLNDGSVLVTDPLRKRVVAYDAQGAFVREWARGFTADSVTLTPNGLVQVRNAITGEVHVFDEKGKPQLSQASETSGIANARLVGPNKGSIDRPGASTLELSFDETGLRLLSLQRIATGRDSNVYVAIEATAGGDAVDVRKYVRKYDSNGRLVDEIPNVPIDYYVYPTNEFRVRNGVIYQLFPSKTEVQIHEWDTN